MGIDYSFFPVVGFVVDEAALEPLVNVVGELYHLEDRYDQKTGAKLEPVKIVDSQEKRGYALEGEAMVNSEGDPMDFCETCEEISRKIGCAAQICGSDSNSSYFAVFGPKIKPVEDHPLSMDDGRISSEPPLLFSDVVASSAIEMARIRAELTILGVKVDEPIVGVGWFVS